MRVNRACQSTPPDHPQAKVQAHYDRLTSDKIVETVWVCQSCYRISFSRPFSFSLSSYFLSFSKKKSIIYILYIYNPLYIHSANRTIVTWSSLRASFEVNFCSISKTNTPLQRHWNSLNEGGLFAKIQQEIAPWRLLEVSRCINISIDHPWRRQCTRHARYSTAIITRCDLDWVQKVWSKSLAIDLKKNGLHSFSRDQEWPAFVLKKLHKHLPSFKAL